MGLYHFSEDPSIRVFRPHIARTSAIQDEAFVWAIDDWHAPTYFLPRDCPRVCFWAGPQTSDEACSRWLNDREPRFVMLVEADWLERIRNAELYRYTMPEGSFRPAPLGPRGTYVSRETVTPLQMDPVGDLLLALSGAGVELRVLDRLGPMWKEIRSGSSLSFSGIRLLNAIGYPEEFRDPLGT